METNRDLYQALEALLAARADSPAPSLEAFLTSLRTRAQSWAGNAGLTLPEFFALLAASFDAAETESAKGTPLPAFEAWEQTISGQILDLQQMHANGQLNDPQRYFGLDAPSRRRWYNFDPHGFLECGAAGSFGGWEEGDATGRVYVPGPVAALGDDGRMHSVDPRELDEPAREIGLITWEDFEDFLRAGQQYE